MIKDIIKEHRSLLILTLLIIIWGGGFQFFLDIKEESIFYFYDFENLIYSLLITPFLYLFCIFVAELKKTKDIKTSIKKSLYVIHPETVLRLGLCSVCLYIIMLSFLGVKSLIPVVVPYKFDPLLSSIDRFLHFGKYPHEYFGNLMYSPDIMIALDRFYYFWLLFMLCYLLWVFLLPQNTEGRMTYIISFFSSWIVLGNVFAIVLSSAGPIFWNEFYDWRDNPYDFIWQAQWKITQDNFLYRDRLYDYLIRNYRDDKLLALGSISAMPSLHIVISALMVFHSWNYKRILWPIMLLYLFVVTVASILLGWHYAVDSYVAFVGAYIIWKISCFFFQNKTIKKVDL